MLKMTKEIMAKILDFKNKDGDWLNKKGEYVPQGNITATARKDTNFVVKTALKFSKVSMSMSDLWDQVWIDYYNHVEVEYDPNMKYIVGSNTLTAVSQTAKVIIQVQPIKKTNSNVIKAKALMEKLIVKWGKSSDHRAIAFLKTSMEEKWTLTNIKTMLKTPIPKNAKGKKEDPDWAEIKELLRKCVDEIGKDSYFRVQTKPNGKNWETIPMNFSSFK